MGFKDILAKMGEKRRERKEMIKELDTRVRIQKLVEERSKSANERELNRFQNEDREVEIKEALEIARKKREHEINFEHNPINAKNIMKAEWEILKEKNQFSGRSNVFSNHHNMHKSNPNLLKNNKKICGI